MPRLDRALHALPEIFDGHQPVKDGALQLAGEADRVLETLHADNLRVALAFGQMGLGMAIGDAIAGAVLGSRGQREVR